MASHPENFFLARSLLKNIRAYQRHRDRLGHWARACRKFDRVLHNVLSVATGSDINVNAQFGRNLRLPHPNGVVIHSDVVIGDDCMVMQQVTIGQLAKGGVPRIGSHVYIGSGAKVLGPINIGDGAAIGANAVVLRDVPAGSRAVGVPARIVKDERTRAVTDPD